MIFAGNRPSLRLIVNSRGISAAAKSCLVLGLAGFLVSCDTPEKRALRELTRAGIEPSGQALLDAVTREDTALIDTLLEANVYREQKDGQGRTPLRVAVDGGANETVTRLLARGVNADVAAKDGLTPLGVAAERENLAMVRKLLEAGARPDANTRDGEKVTPWAIHSGRFELAGELIRAGTDPHQKDRSDNPLLHVAMHAKQRQLMDQLIRLGADPGQTNAVGETTLHAAIRNGWLDVIPSLVTAGADPNLPAPSQLPPLAQAVRDGHPELVALLLRCGADPNYRHPSAGVASAETRNPSAAELAFDSGDRALLGKFLAHKTKPETASINRWLWEAVTNHDRELANLLLAHGARADARNAAGWLPIEVAVLQGNASLIKLLTDYGSPFGRSMHLVAMRGDTRLAHLLLALGADPDIVHPPYQDRPLSLAIRGKHDVLAAALIGAGAGTQFQLPEGQYPLHLAVAKVCPITVRALLAAGADPNMPFQLPVSPEFIRQVRPGVIRWALKMDRNVTLLMVAADSGMTETAGALLRAKAKTETWTKVARLWPINFASRRGDVKMMRLILGRDPLKEERHIVINLGEQRARVYDSDGNEIFNTKVSTGRKGFATPTGEFVITNKHRDWTSTLYDASMPYFQRLSCSDFGMHQGVVPGYPASHGCIRVPAGNAAKLFSMTQAGDRVRIVP